MRRTVYRPCAICATGYVKCSQNSQTKTCSLECSGKYGKNAKQFYTLEKGWHKANDIPTYKNTPAIRIGNKVMLKAHR